MNLNSYLTKDYENKQLCRCVKTNPIQSQYKAKTNPIPERPKMNVNSFITKDYRKNDAFAVQKNKANTNPIKPNFKPNLVKMGHHEGKMFFTHLLNSNAANRELKMIK